MRTRRFLLGGLLVALLGAGIGSYYASTRPDGLAHVAEQTGFADRSQDSPTSDGPFAGYSTRGVEDDRVGGGVAGLVGAGLTLVLAGGLFWVLRRRSDDDRTDQPAPDRDSVDSEV